MNLVELCASLLVLRQITHAYHWIVKGSNFVEIHTLLQDQYTQLLTFADLVAEDIRTLDGIPPLTLGDIVSKSIIEDEVKDTSQKSMLLHVHNCLATIANKIEDMEFINKGIDNHVADIQAYLHKQMWFIKSIISQ